MTALVELIEQHGWGTFGIALIVFGLTPGFVLRLIIQLYPRDDPRRKELLGELPHVRWIERPFWVLSKLELALFEGLPARRAAGSRRLPPVKAKLIKFLVDYANTPVSKGMSYDWAPPAALTNLTKLPPRLLPKNVSQRRTTVSGSESAHEADDD
jgi:hypothetical protein